MRRNLSTQIAADEFVDQVLGIHDDDGGRKAAKIVGAELGLYSLEDRPTISHKDYRVASYRSPKDRNRLCETILFELIDLERLPNDDQITLGAGGARPKTVQSDAQAYIVSGPPASGKSTIAETLAEQHGAYILDSDYAKRKFPEYQLYDAGASLVHQESDQIIFGPDRPVKATTQCLFEYCAYKQHNMVIPMVGRTTSSMESICNQLIKALYTVHIVNVVLEPQECAVRAFNRFCETGRYVPLSYVYDEVGNKPEVTYFRLKRNHTGDPNIASFTQVSTEVKPPQILERSENSPL